MNNKKCTSVADLIKPIKKHSHETSVNDLIKPKKKNLHKISETSVTELIKSKKKNSHKTSVTDLIKPRKKYLYPCHCVCCNSEEDDFHTQEKYTKDNSLWELENTRKNQKNAIMVRKQKRSINIHDADPAEVNLSKKRKRDSHHASSSNPDSFQPNNNKEGFQPNNNNEDDDIYVLSDSFRPDSASSSKPSHFRIPAPTFGDDIIDQDENEDNEDEDNEDEDEDDEDNEDEDNEDKDKDDDEDSKDEDEDEDEDSEDEDNEDE